MSWEERLELVSKVAGTDLSAASNQFRVVKFNSNAGDVTLATATTDKPAGILYDVALTGRAVPVVIDGICKCLAGGTIAAGDPVATKADGSLQTAVTTQYVIGTAQEGAVSGDLFPVLVTLPASIKA